MSNKCSLHKRLLIKYCAQACCRTRLCAICEKKHAGHELLDEMQVYIKVKDNATASLQHIEKDIQRRQEVLNLLITKKQSEANKKEPANIVAKSLQHLEKIIIDFATAQRKASQIVSMERMALLKDFKQSLLSQREKREQLQQILSRLSRQHDFAWYCDAYNKLDSLQLHEDDMAARIAKNNSSVDDDHDSDVLIEVNQIIQKAIKKVQAIFTRLSNQN